MIVYAYQWQYLDTNLFIKLFMRQKPHLRITLSEKRYRNMEIFRQHSGNTYNEMFMSILISVKDITTNSLKNTLQYHWNKVYTMPLICSFSLTVFIYRQAWILELRSSVSVMPFFCNILYTSLIKTSTLSNTGKRKQRWQHDQIEPFVGSVDVIKFSLMIKRCVFSIYGSIEQN